MNCPYCSGQMVLPGFNDLATTHPDVVQHWDYGRNDLDPSGVSAGSKKRMWWICDEGHSWQVAVHDKVHYNIVCPYCSNKKVLVGFNDLATTYPEYAQKVSSQSTVQPTEVTFGSKRKLVWECEDGHMFEASPEKVIGAGRWCPYCSGNKVSNLNSLAAKRPRVAAEFDEERNGKTAHEVSYASNKKHWWCCRQCGLFWEARVLNRTINHTGCPQCAARFSTQEKELYDFVEGILPAGSVIRCNVRSVIPPKELDIYIPGKNIAIEFNGLYWHSEAAGKDRSYHYEKWLACKNKGIQLITIWADQWVNTPGVVKNMLTAKLGLCTGSLGARTTTVDENLSTAVVRRFMDSYHIQGFASSTYHVGLRDRDGELVAVSSWRKNKDKLYLDRYATSRHVVGGLGKLLKRGIGFALERDCSEIITFADHEVSDGGLYETLGFDCAGMIPPEYKYVSPLDGYATRHHKFGFRLRRFRQDPRLEFREGYTERQLAELNGLSRIYDCGKTRYVMAV